MLFGFNAYMNFMDLIMRLYRFKYAFILILALMVGRFSSFGCEKVNVVPVGPIHTLKQDHQCKICSLLPFPDFVSMSLVSVTWNEIARETYNRMSGSVLVMGDIGSGKSSLVYLLAGKTLDVQRVKQGHYQTLAWQFGTKGELPNITITNEWKDIPLSLCLVEDQLHNRSIWDCPSIGTNTRTLDENFSNAEKIYHRLKGKVKLIYVTAATSCYQDVGFGLNIYSVINNLAQIFQGQNQLQNLLSLVVTKEEKGKKGLQYLQDIAVKNQDNLPPQERLSPGGRALLKSLIEHPNQVIDFPAPLKDGTYVIHEDLKQLIDNKTYGFNPQVNAPKKKSLQDKKWCTS